MAITDRQKHFLNKIVPITGLNLGDVIYNLQTGVVDANSIGEEDLERAASGKLLIGQGSGADVGWKSLSGDVANDADGVTTIQARAVSDGMLEGTDHSTVGASKLFKLAIGEWDASNAVAAVAASATDINTETDTITVTAHGLSDGDCVNATTSDTLPTGISADTAYYVGEVTTDTFQLFDTRAHAIAGGATGLVNITAAGTGNQTFTSLTAIGQHYLGATLPDNALIVGGGVEVFTTLADGADDSATVALQVNGANDIVTATAISAGGNIWDEGNHDIVPDNTGSTAIKLTAERELLAVIADDQIPTGKFRVWLLYIEGT